MSSLQKYDIGIGLPQRQTNSSHIFKINISLEMIHIPIIFHTSSSDKLDKFPSESGNEVNLLPQT